MRTAIPMLFQVEIRVVTMAAAVAADLVIPELSVALEEPVDRTVVHVTSPSDWAKVISPEP